jgi:hypothetical protein
MYWVASDCLRSFSVPILYLYFNRKIWLSVFGTYKTVAGPMFDFLYVFIKIQKNGLTGITWHSIDSCYKLRLFVSISFNWSNLSIFSEADFSPFLLNIAA